MPGIGLDDLLNLSRGVGHFVHALHRKVDLVYAVGSGKVARYRVGNQHSLVLDLRLPEVRDALFEDTDDRERNAENLKGLANCQIVASILFLGKLLRDYGD